MRVRRHRERTIATLDETIGHGVERLVVRHHRRRLRRLDRLACLDAPPGGYAAAEPPPRAGNAVEILLDGENALPRMADELERARSHVHLAGWFFSPEFRLRPDGPGLRDVLAELAGRVDVRVLSWAGSPLPLFHPDRGQGRELREALTRGTKIQCALDSHERPMHCHHEKLVIVDDRVAFVGGIDLTDYAGCRFDRRDHPARDGIGWHDVAGRLEGPIVADVAEHFRLRWEAVTGERAPEAAAGAEAGETEAQLVRTVPERIYPALPRGDFRILESYLRALRSAQRLVYLENQFLWSPEIGDLLCEKLRRPPTDEFRLLVLLPARPNNGADHTRGQLGRLVAADDGSGRFLACTLHQRGGVDPRPVYVHAKIGIVDDAWLTLGSANLNEHSLFNDTEVNVASWEPRLARDTRLALWAEHLECDVDDPRLLDPAKAFDDLWRPVAEEQLERRSAGHALTHRLLRLPHVSRRTAALRGPIDGLLVDG
ncbi:MAG TPA: phospholipase D family protein [Gaiellaceae bacterium]|nr:phospholipase D family protein [Gaiellaceae bacterium]